MPESEYIKGLGWVTQVLMVYVDMVCSGVYGCGCKFVSNEVYPASEVDILYQQQGRPVPSICVKCLPED